MYCRACVGESVCEDYPGIGPPRQTLEPLAGEADVGAIGWRYSPQRLSE
eukprot:CAMPEP_0180136890 /NCGR_PEP_ID=MMETSP0986-20121125/11825_1 /TAXON_ID=697907 /ORGANISM="non described non described, Strain CCMP2293" /LENGTH=48 /DNA_ID= /DNA_START= /DNA_END= /DNA_ORIENTATION=